MWSHRRQPTRLPRPWDSPGKNTGVGCHFLLQCMQVKSESEVAQSCLTLSDPMDCSLPVSSIHGIFQVRVLEWGAIAFIPQFGFLSSTFTVFLPNSCPVRHLCGLGLCKQVLIPDISYSMSPSLLALLYIRWQQTDLINNRNKCVDVYYPIELTHLYLNKPYLLDMMSTQNGNLMVEFSDTV